MVGLDPYELTVRIASAGGGTTGVQPKRRGGRNPIDTPGLTNLTFFVHGFNNVQAVAMETWDEKTWPAVRCAVPRRFLRGHVYFYWPGDVSRNELLTAVAYPKLIPNALESARGLAKYLERFASKKDVMSVKFVAHSLGCLVVLETLRLIQNNPKIEVKRALLMAAAVPEHKCMNKGMNESVGQKAYEQPVAKYEEILFSSKDRVLGAAFEVGQLLAGEFKWRGRGAVGRTGGPSGRWRKYHGDTGLSHSAYWRHKSTVKRIIQLFLPIEQTRNVKQRVFGSRNGAQDFLTRERPIKIRRQFPNFRQSNTI